MLERKTRTLSRMLSCCFWERRMSCFSKLTLPESKVMWAEMLHVLNVSDPRPINSHILVFVRVLSSNLQISPPLMVQKSPTTTLGWLVKLRGISQEIYGWHARTEFRFFLREGLQLGLHPEGIPIPVPLSRCFFARQYKGGPVFLGGLVGVH